MHPTWSIKDSFFPGNHFWFFSTKNSELKLRMSCYENWCMLFHFQRCRIACQTDKRAFVTVDVTFYVVGFCSCLCCECFLNNISHQVASSSLLMLDSCCCCCIFCSCCCGCLLYFMMVLLLSQQLYNVFYQVFKLLTAQAGIFTFVIVVLVSVHCF